jgi:hypothetical protein
LILLAKGVNVRGLLDWRAPIWAQAIVSTLSLLVAVMRVMGSFRRRGLADISLLLVSGALLIAVAYSGLRAMRTGRSDWGWGAVMGYGVFGAVLLGMGLLLASR